MESMRGKIRRSDIEGGVTQLETADGDVYELGGEVGAEWLGKAVVVEGTVDRHAMSFTMTGPRFIVKKIKAL